MRKHIHSVTITNTQNDKLPEKSQQRLKIINATTLQETDNGFDHFKLGNIVCHNSQ